MTDSAEDTIGIIDGNGGQIPALGFGTWDLRGESAARSVEYALETGYRHIDTAEMYNNEEAVGKGIKNAPVDREDIFLTTKVWHNHLEPETLKQTLEDSLRRLSTDYVDLLLIHWPKPGLDHEEPLTAMAELREAGKVKHVGVSNFTVDQMREAQNVSPAPIFCNQVEYHPYLSQAPVLEYCQENDIVLTAYCPLARGDVFDDETVQDIAMAHGKNPSQVVLRWLLQQDNVAAIPRSGNKAHIRENFHIFDFELSEDEMKRISALEQGHRICEGVGVPSPDWDT